MKVFDYISTTGPEKVVEDFLNVGLGRTYHFSSNEGLSRGDPQVKGKLTLSQGLKIVGLFFASIVTIIFLIIAAVNRAKILRIQSTIILQLPSTLYRVQEGQYNPYTNIPNATAFENDQNKLSNMKSDYEKFRDQDYRRDLTQLVAQHTTCAQNEKVASIILNIFAIIRNLIENADADENYKINNEEIDSDITELNKLVSKMKSKVVGNESLNSDACKRLSSQTFESLSQRDSTPKEAPYEEFLTSPIEEQIPLLKQMIHSTNENTLITAKIYIEMIAPQQEIESDILELNELIKTLKANNESKGFHLASIKKMQFYVFE